MNFQSCLALPMTGVFPYFGKIKSTVNLSSTVIFQVFRTWNNNNLQCKINFVLQLGTYAAIDT